MYLTKENLNGDIEGVFWNDQMDSAISVYSETEITDQQADVLQRLGVA